MTSEGVEIDRHADYLDSAEFRAGFLRRTRDDTFFTKILPVRSRQTFGTVQGMGDPYRASRCHLFLIDLVRTDVIASREMETFDTLQHTMAMLPSLP